ncbi:guanosine-3',5'-bis(diphosphate) 3'-pyrophosphohydrolase [Acinetobacter sichuanensis]|uniref:Guanosine-3',5'-bis(Diphosphate) 3'-pyrophosphohydrolase n=1 Tax=Acinetobacter sichuanensis TaxID=2136183 RepID=A0A371YL37_9GAMM|nr:MULTISPECIES: guanosine-3',5'-bis(diphosphate) 3'-pyrophosphohydrolase [Acinetobacter]MDM1247507.1 guanosine-3',5'-bis(diphosphate) 3'-pyrophosphohydrolase [Acinetobacter sp. R933-2]MDM1763272.1 guanosine-3',5'-bis(diphosphate) 3'-pyrophosphohydrolase [Acinetobacter sp. 226-1]MDM1766751.1 guanosine-3',5'-bis(diphosphate) 3'-pyrophosphohydrolase [Acinetobacter sp. 226-4]MDQ9020291.1 guanosine-3',5'-bis(diphosphate) 3'-pyrophosphohydrolase [Acinetobacter sichuanensis]RFC82176.1 guanosine-3',5
MSTIEKAIALAAKKHTGQLDKGGQPYIFHPLRLMLKVHHPQQQIVAVLHDILEDTDTTIVDLISLGFNQDTIDAILALTKKSGETRIQAAYRAAKNPIAKIVKLADVMDNMDLTRIPQPTQRDLQRLEEYKKVYEILQNS